MAALSRPVVYGALALLAVGVVLWSSGSPAAAPAPTARKRVAKRTTGPDWDLPLPDPKLRFRRLAGTSRNVFAPLVAIERPLAALRPNVETDRLFQVPAKLAGGEAAWAYTGMVEANGVRLALLENKGTQKSGYVREGDLWKTAHVVGITAACVVLADEKGKSETVFRLDPNEPAKPKPEPEGGFRPVGGAPPSGPIGPLSPGRLPPSLFPRTPTP